MQAPSGHMTALVAKAVLEDGALAGEWVLDPGKSSIRLKSRVMCGLVPVNGVSGGQRDWHRFCGRRGQRRRHGGRGVHRHQEVPARHAPALG
jgi:hypothetical protein